MREVKKSVRFYLEKRKKWSGDKNMERPIILNFNYHGNSLHTTIGLRVSEANWDAKKQRVKLNVARSTEANSYLDKLDQKINDIYFAAFAKGDKIDNRYIIDLLKEKEHTQVSFFGEWDKFNEIQKVKLGTGTYKSAMTSYNRFREFCHKRKLAPTFEDINPHLLSQYVEYLLEVGNTNNTIHGNLKRMKWFLNYAAELGLHTNTTYKEFQVAERVGTIKFLEWAEVKALLTLQLEDEAEAKARDLFCFCCLTAMRYSDVEALKKTAIVSHKFEGVPDTHMAAHIRQVKTDKNTVVPLLPEALEILKRYEGSEQVYALPRMALQTVNRLIKEVGRKAALNSMQQIVHYRGNKRETKDLAKWETLTTHVGRRTFVTIAASRGIPINVVAAITGQDPKTTMKHYMGVVDISKFEEIKSKLKF